MKRISYLIGIVLVVVLTACGTQDVQSTQWSEETFSSFISDFSQDVGVLIQEQDTGLVEIMSIPAGSPVGLDSDTNLGTMLLQPSLLANDFLVPLLNNCSHVQGELYLSNTCHPTTPADLHTLPRGVYHYDNWKNVWNKVRDSNDLELQFPFGNLDGSTSAITLLLDWDAYKPLQLVKAPYGTKEVPTGMAVIWWKDGIKAATLRVEALWRKVPACGDTLYEVQGITVDGKVGHAGSNDYVHVDLDYRVTDTQLDLATNSNYNYPAGTNYIPSSQGKIDIGVGNDKATLTWNIDAYAKINRGPECFKGNLELLKGELGMGLHTKINNEQNNVDLSFDFYNFLQTPHLSVDVKNGHVNVNNDTSFWLEGRLGDANKNLIIGDDLIMTFENGDKTTFENFLTDNLQVGNIWFPGF